MKKLTLKWKIDKLIDGNEELRRFSDENGISFLNAINNVICVGELEKLKYYAVELDMNIDTDIFAGGNDSEFSHINHFTYRGIEFYDLVRRGDL